MRIKLLQNTFDSVTGTEYKAGTIVDVEQNRAEQCIAPGWAEEVIENAVAPEKEVKKAVRKSTKK